VASTVHTTTILAINPITLQVADLGRALAFYKDQLGLPFSRTSGRAAQASIGDTSLLLHEDIDPTLREKPRGAGVELHFVVADVDALFKALTESGLETEGPPEDRPWGREFGMCDPDGYELEFLSPPR
jgi:uncharacterized glyoxalase superfamily protein PhnB